MRCVTKRESHLPRWMSDGTAVPKVRYESTHCGMLKEQRKPFEDSTEILVLYPGCTIAGHPGIRESTLRDTESKPNSGGLDEHRVHELVGSCCGPASGTGRYQGATARQAAEGESRNRTNEDWRRLGRRYLQSDDPESGRRPDGNDSCMN